MKTEPVRILLVDDDEDDYLIIKSLLHEALKPIPDLEWISTFDVAHQKITAAEHDVYLVDYRLGAQNGLELLADVGMVQRPEPFIILTGAGDDSIEQQAMEMGVADYLVKGAFGTDLLGRVIMYSLQRKRMEAQRVQHLLDINRSKDEFIALTSHQLRTPATAVKQYIGILLEGYAGDIPPEQYEYLERAYASNERQLKVVNDILRVSQLDLQKMKLHIERYDAAVLVEDCMNELTSVLDERSQTIRFTKPKRPLYINCDPAYLNMAIGNLLDNASKYTPAGKGIQLSVQAKDDMVHIAVQDDGVGIAADDLDKLFKKFSRIDNPLSVEVGGTGLGLYWAQEVVCLHHGTITVESVLHNGTTFTIIMPSAS